MLGNRQPGTWIRDHGFFRDIRLGNSFIIDAAWASRFAAVGCCWRRIKSGAAALDSNAKVFHNQGRSQNGLVKGAIGMVKGGEGEWHLFSPTGKLVPMYRLFLVWRADFDFQRTGSEFAVPLGKLMIDDEDRLHLVFPLRDQV